MGGEAHSAYGLGGLLALGGLVGYVRAGSVMSAVGGGGVGAALIASGYVIDQGHELEGHTAAAATNTLLTMGMAPRFLKGFKPVPGLVVLVGALGTAYHTKKALDWYH